MDDDREWNFGADVIGLLLLREAFDTNYATRHVGSYSYCFCYPYSLALHGGKIVHSELRSGDAPSAEAQADHEDHDD